MIPNFCLHALPTVKLNNPWTANKTKLKNQMKTTSMITKLVSLLMPVGNMDSKILYIPGEHDGVWWGKCKSWLGSSSSVPSFAAHCSTPTVRWTNWPCAHPPPPPNTHNGIPIQVSDCQWHQSVCQGRSSTGMSLYNREDTEGTTEGL